MQDADNLYEPSYNHDDAFLDLLDILNEYTSDVEKEWNKEGLRSADTDGGKKNDSYRR